MLTKAFISGIVPWREIICLIALRLLDSSGGLSTIRQALWTPLEDYSYRSMGTSAFNKIMSLSSDFHDNKTSGRLWQTVMRGQAVKHFISDIFFTVGPLFVDLFLAVSVLYYMFDVYMGLTIGAVAVLFVWTSKKIVFKKSGVRRGLNEAITKEFSVLCESTENWPTVAYFNRVPHEKDRYSNSVSNHLFSRRSWRFWGYTENAIESWLLLLGLLVACFIAANAVVSGVKPVGNFVMLLSYWAQLSGPLRFLANGLGQIANDLVDMEEFIDLLKTKPTITNTVHAKPLVAENTSIEFKDVNFSYDSKRKILRNINFRATSGQTIALVGQTGGGKSTILKLIPRFYDPTEGVVKIADQDISHVTLESLRNIIGVVPQDPAMFHDTILNNVRYAKLDASDEEVIEACKAVALHDRILSFSEGYLTKVGERGVKLSGGELQRVAIARAIIKNPKIVLLDEATSSVDSETEAHVQKSLKQLTDTRTTVVIA